MWNEIIPDGLTYCRQYPQESKCRKINATDKTKGNSIRESGTPNIIRLKNDLLCLKSMLLTYI